MSEPPLVTIFLATYNGERHLAEQLNSIVSQTCERLKIIASDDGSTDQTLAILQQYSVETHQGPRQGFTANFLKLLEKVVVASEYYAFSDQDDVWEPDKLQRAIAYLATVAADKPALYCGRTLLVNEKLRPYGYSSLFKKPPHFLNALVQNIGGGNTMVFNQAAFALLRQTKNKHAIAFHDWWTYLLISGAGGKVFYDAIPALHYRQHQHNLIGNNMSWQARFNRLRKLFQGTLKARLDQNNQNLLDVAYLLTPQHREQLEKFERVRKSWFVPRLINLWRLGVYRQSWPGQVGLFFLAVMNRL